MVIWEDAHFVPELLLAHNSTKFNVTTEDSGSLHYVFQTTISAF